MASSNSADIKFGNRFLQLVGRAIDVRPNEIGALAWSSLYVFALFLSYYILRPIRDELGTSGGVENLPWLFTGTLVAMMLVNPLFSYAVKRWTRRKFIALTYRFFMLNLLIFMILLKMATSEQLVWIGRIFFIWVSIFNLFVVSVFWSFIVDVFSTEQGKRLFGVLAAGSTVGGIAGSAITSGFVEELGQSWLLLVSIILLEVAVFASQHLSRMTNAFLNAGNTEDNSQQKIGGGVFAGMLHTFRSPYLLGIACFILFYTFTSTILYFHQASIVESEFSDRASRTAFFANIDLWVNVLTLVVQVSLTGRLVRLLGMALTLSILPFISVIGFATLASFPVIGVFVVVQVARRVSNFSMARPAREVLFTSISREDRYKAKNFIDTVIYRSGDQLASWSYAGLVAIGLGITSIAWVAVPVSGVWLVLSFWLGRQQVKRAADDIKVLSSHESTNEKFIQAKKPACI